MRTLTVTDMHTGGEPVRIVTGGYPPVPAGTILEKRAYVRDHLDHLRKVLMFEPRGHYDMYGVLPVKPDLPGADLAVLFMHNEGYSTMCGHATIALGRYAVDQGLVEKREPVTTVNIEAPCGMVVASVEVEDGKAGAVSFERAGIPLCRRPGGRAARRRHGPFRHRLWRRLLRAGRLPAVRAGVRQSRVRDFVDAATALTGKLKAEFPLSHPAHADLGFLYGTILTDGKDEFSDEPTKNVCVFAEAEVDRSPTGSGVTARLAAMHAKGRIGIGQERLFESITGSRFSGAVERTTREGGHQAIVARVGGRAFYSGKAEFSVEPEDELGRGFLLR